MLVQFCLTVGRWMRKEGVGREERRRGGVVVVEEGEKEEAAAAVGGGDDGDALRFIAKR